MTKNIPNGHEMDQTALKYTNIFHCKTLTNVPKLGTLAIKIYHLAALPKTEHPSELGYWKNEFLSSSKLEQHLSSLGTTFLLSLPKIMSDPIGATSRHWFFSIQHFLRKSKPTLPSALQTRVGVSRHFFGVATFCDRLGNDF
jgi:hypothetical protein